MDIPGVLFTLWPDGGVPAFPEAIVDLADARGARVAQWDFVRLRGAGQISER